MDGVASGFVTLLVFLLMLGLLVLVHEIGHFWTARRLGIKVDEFGIGFPPRAKVLFERDGVKYTLNWLPIGGFVRFGGEGETLYGVGSLAAAAPWKKILVLLAGPLMNLFLAYVIFTGLLIVNGQPTEANGVEVVAVLPNTPASSAGFQDGDVIVKLGGRDILRDITIIKQIAAENKDRPIEAVVIRDGQQTALQVTPGPWSSEGQTYPSGFGFSYNNSYQNVPVSLPAALVQGFQLTWQTLGRFLGALGDMVGGLFGLNVPPQGGVTGIVGMARGTGEVIERYGLPGFWEWTALISLNLFLFNLLPIPALDGSHIVFSLIEMVRRGKKIPPEKEAMVHAIGFMMLMGLVVIVTISDVANWIGGAPALGQ